MLTQEEAPPQLDLVGAGDPEDTVGQDLPAVPTERIISACLTTSGLIAAVGLLIRGRAVSAGPAALQTDPAAVAGLLQCRYKAYHPSIKVSLGIAGSTDAHLSDHGTVKSNEHTFALTSDHQHDEPQANLMTVKQHKGLVLGIVAQKACC